MTPEEILIALAARGFGIDVQFRRAWSKPTEGWHGKEWRARLLSSKNENSEYRLTAYGDTFDEVIATLAHTVHSIDIGGLCVPR